MGKEFSNKFLIPIILALILSLFNCSLHCYAEENINNRKQVLIISSYHYGDEWTQDILSSLNTSLSEYKNGTEISVEYMDTRKYDDSNYYKELYKFYKSKYANVKFDAVVGCDNAAFDFLKKYSSNIFGNTPVIFCGVNGYEDSMIKGLPNFTGVAEIVDFDSNIDLILKLLPKTDTIAIITDTKPTGKGLTNDLSPKLQEYNLRVHMDLINASSLRQVEEYINKLPKNSAVIFHASLTDDSGKYISSTKATEILSKEYNVPIFSCWDFYVNHSHGVVGGMMTIGKKQGEFAASQVIKVLNGQSASKIPVIKAKPESYIFNYNGLHRYGIKNSLLPKGSQIIDTPSEAFKVPKNLMLIITISIISILFVIIVALLISTAGRKTAQQKLKKSEELLRTLINATPDIICFKDGEGRWLEANMSILRIFRLGLIDYRNKTDAELILSSEDCIKEFKEFDKTDKFAWEKGTILREEKKISEPNGDARTYDIIKVPIFKRDNTRNGLVILGRDVTERERVLELKKNAEESSRMLNEMLEYDKLRTEFFANISHELRTPLNVILGALQLLQLIEKNGEMELKADKVQDYSNVMKQNCYRLVRIVNNLIDITKIDAGYFQVEPSNNDIIRVVEDITLSVKEYVESKGIELIFDTDVEEKEMAFDPDKIERIILNLLSNSIKFTESGGKISVTITDKDKSVQISVKDTGIGIPKEMQKDVFERFIQVDKSLSRNREGSGIGLSLVKSLVELHHGTIRLISEYEKGSEFIIELPAEIIPGEKKQGKTQMQQSNIEKINIEFSDIYS